MKIFLRTGAFYRAENKTLSDDLELSELLNAPVAENPCTVQCNCKSEISDLKKQVADLIKNQSLNTGIKETPSNLLSVEIPTKRVTKKSDTAKKK